MKQIADIMLQSILKRTREQMDLTLQVEDPAKELLIEKGYDQKYGARPLRRTIQNMVEDQLAEEILDGRIKKGDHVLVSSDGKVLMFQVAEPKEGEAETAAEKNAGDPAAVS